MNLLNKIVFDIDTKFVSESSSNFISIYSEDNPDWFVNLKKTIELSFENNHWYGKNLVLTTFSGLNANMIDQLINIQVNTTREVGGDELEALSDSPNSLSFEELTLLSDMKSWIMERRAKDIESHWLKKQETDHDTYVRGLNLSSLSIDGFCDTVDSTLGLIQFWSGSSYNPKTIEAAISKLKNKNIAEINKILKIKYLEKIGEDKWKFSGEENTLDQYYKFLVEYTYESPKKEVITVDYEGYAARGQRRATMKSGLLEKLEKLKDRNLLERINESELILKIGGFITKVLEISSMAVENSKEREDAYVGMDFRAMDRAADCTGMVPTFQRQAAAYTNAGYELNDQGSRIPFSPKRVSLSVVPEELNVKCSLFDTEDENGVTIEVDLKEEQAIDTGTLAVEVIIVQSTEPSSQKFEITKGCLGDFNQEGAIFSKNLEIDGTDPATVICRAQFTDNLNRLLMQGSATITIPSEAE